MSLLSHEESVNEEIDEIAHYQIVSEEENIDYQDPIIQVLEKLFKYCLKENVSDIHIEPKKQDLVVRLRIDGVLHLYKTYSQQFASRMISRIKLLAKLDISESRLPQDGQFSFKTTLAETLDFRVSTLPTAYGEKLVLRL